MDRRDPPLRRRRAEWFLRRMGGGAPLSDTDTPRHRGSHASHMTAGSDASASGGGALTRPDPTFFGVLFASPAPRAEDGRPPGAEVGPSPDFFRDLNLDAVLATIIEGRERYGLAPIFCTPLRDAGEVRYRQDVFRDLDGTPLRESVGGFSADMEDVRRRLTLVEQLRHPLERQAWLLNAMGTYCSAVRSLSRALAGAGPRSRGLRALGAHLDGYLASTSFGELEAGTRRVAAAIDGIDYALLIRGTEVTVDRPGEEPDLGAEVERTFARFRQGAGAHDGAQAAAGATGLSQVEARISELVAEQHPEAFRMLAEHCVRHADFIDATVARFHRDVQFVLAYLDLMAPLRRAGLPFCYPTVTTDSRDLAALDAFDIALANVVVAGGGTVVLNDVRLEHRERALIVSGPNNGGKTTFARMFGQLHHLAALGVPVPARSARLPLADKIFTHFERVEQPESLRGKLDDELSRVHEILEAATSESVIVMNESFSSTSLEDARVVGAAILRRILAIGAACVYVTFIEELATLSDATVSMVSQIAVDDPARRTFEVVRAPADGLAYAWAVADRHGLSYVRLMDGAAK